MNKMEELAAVLAKLRKTLKAMQNDPRSTEIDFQNAIQQLHLLVREESQRLTDQETEYFKNHQANFSNQIADLDTQADQLQNLLETASNAVDIIGAVEAIAKFFRPV